MLWMVQKDRTSALPVMSSTRLTLSVGSQEDLVLKLNEVMVRLQQPCAGYLQAEYQRAKVIMPRMEK